MNRLKVSTEKNTRRATVLCPSDVERFEFGGRAVSVRVWEKGDTILLVHSSGCDSRQWRRLVENWVQTYRVVAPDLIGCGQTGTWQGNEEYTLADEARIVAEIISQSATPVHLVGHSYGGAVALHAAVACTTRLASLCLIEPSAFHLLRSGSSSEQAAYDEIYQLAQDVESLIRGGEPDAAMMKFVDYWWGSGTWKDFDIEKQTQLAKLAKKLPGDFARLFEGSPEKKTIGRLTIPTLIICGTNSPAPARLVSRIVANTIQGSRHRTLAYAGHMSPITHTKEINQLIDQHLDIASQTKG